MRRWDDNHLVMKVVVYRAFIVTGMFIQPIRLCCRSQVALVGPILRLSVPASNQVGYSTGLTSEYVSIHLDQEYLYGLGRSI